MTESELQRLVNPKKYQVFLLTCRAHMPVSFASHPWFVINDHGTLSRWEIVWGKCSCKTRWGKIHKDALPFFAGIQIFHFSRKFLWSAHLEGSTEGALAEKMGRFIEESKDTYIFRNTYSILGPNSNTYVQWVLNAFPEFKATLPWNAFGKNFKRKIKNGVVHGRFQPPHNGHIRYILLALEKCDHLMIGISTPKICTEEEARISGYPCTQALNPFTHEERADMIRLSLEEAGITSSRYTIIPFPSDYKNIKALLPQNSVFLMSVTSESDKKKIAYLEEKGFKTETILTHEEDASRERSGKVRAQAKEGANWEYMVPKAIAEYLKKHGLIGKLAGTDSVLE